VGQQWVEPNSLVSIYSVPPLFIIHTIAVLPNAIIGEYFPHYAPLFAEIGELHIDITSSIDMICDAPGLGVRMYEDALASHKY
jgi:hypothetical protein